MKRHSQKVDISKMNEKDISRFWSYVDKTNDCWVWNGHRVRRGYGAFSFKDYPWVASRVSWYLENGEIKKGLLVCHTCDNPPCVNPAHLFLGTSKDNSRDMVEKNRVASGSKNGAYTHPEKRVRLPGEKNSMAKLSNSEAKEIREKYKTGSYSQYDLADQYGITQHSINRIVNNKGYVK